MHADFTGVLRRAEIARGTRQVMVAVGLVELRNVVAVRRAHADGGAGAGAGAGGTGERARNWEDEREFWELERSAEDDEDEGGDVGLGSVADRAQLRARRSFEIVLTSGGVLKYEVCGVVACQVSDVDSVDLGPGFFVQLRARVDRASAFAHRLLEEAPRGRRRSRDGRRPVQHRPSARDAPQTRRWGCPE